MELELVYLSPMALKPYEGNTRKHAPQDIEQIKESILADGFNDPIGIWGEDNLIVEGHGRQIAAIELGLEKVPCIRLDHLNETQRKEYAIRHNRTAELSAWDFGKLEEEIAALEIEGVDLSGLEFDLEEMETHTDASAVQEDDFDPDEPVEAKAKRGDIWQLGRHRLMCGDSTDEGDVTRLMDGAKADMAFTDPPYGVEYTGGIQFKDGYVEKNNREMIRNDDADIYEDVFKRLSEFVDGACYIWFAGTKAKSLYEAADAHGTIHALIVWVKNGGYGALNANYKQKHEPCLYWNPRGTTLAFCGDTTETTVWAIDKDGVNQYHPTQKPVALAAKAIANHEADTVLDLFGGSGSTLIACEELDRTCYMMELDPHYCDVIIKRWEDLTGGEAVLVNG